MKKIISLIAAAAICTTTVMSVGATDVTPTSVPSSGNTTVSATVSPTYTVTIPSNAELKAVTDGTLSADGEISVTAVKLRKGYKLQITVSSENDFVMTSVDAAELAYTLKCGTNEVSTAKNLVTEFATNTAPQKSTLEFAAGVPDFAGDYSDLLTFTIAQVAD